ncbi:MAG: S-layer homology domain-containing protein, partial [Thermicanus sp.]|nr:S-layer homology domain-containing protein [Thermicanus sp.]
RSGKPIQLVHDSFTVEIPSAELAHWLKEGSLLLTLKMEEGKADVPISIAEIKKTTFVSPILTIGGSDQMLINPLHLTLKIEAAQGVDSRLVGAYRRGEDGKWSYAGSPLQWKSSEVEIYTTRLGSFAAIEYKKTFADIANHWAKSPVEVLASQHLLKGKNDNDFVPEGKITRAEFAAMLVRMLGLKGESYKGSFQDVKETDWFVSEVEAAAKAGIVTGFQGKFRPGEHITRQDMVVMLLRAAQLTEKSLTKGDQVSLNAFQDKEEIAGYAKEAVAVAVANQIINGMVDHRFVPMGDATRAQAAKVLYQFLFGTNNQ